MTTATSTGPIDAGATVEGSLPPATTHRPAAAVRVAGIYRWELRKLVSQIRVQVAVLACVVAPIGFVAILNSQASTPTDTLFGRWVHVSGFATPLVILSFAGQWAFPALMALVAGDVFSAEDRHGTWKMLLSRSRSRGEFFTAKLLAVLTYSILAMVLLSATSLLAGVIFVGADPIPGLSGQLVPAGQATSLVLLSWLSTVLATLAFAAMAVLASIASRSTVVGIAVPVGVGLVMQLVALANGLGWWQNLLLSSPYVNWHGLWVQPAFHAGLLASQLVPLVYIVILLGAAGLVLHRRDERGK